MEGAVAAVNRTRSRHGLALATSLHVEVQKRLFQARPPVHYVVHALDCAQVVFRHLVELLLLVRAGREPEIDPADCFAAGALVPVPR
jgi:hypothetical protein